MLFTVIVLLASGSIITLVPAIALLCLVLAVTASTWSRRVRADTLGLRESSVFGTWRVPWAAVANMEHLDINRKRWEKARKGRGSHRSPFRSHWVYLLTDREGREILSLSEVMEPGERFKALLERIQKSIEANTPHTAESLKLMQIEKLGE